MKKIYYVAEEDFSRPTAGVMRIINNCKSISYSGESEIKIIGYSNESRSKFENFEIINVPRGNSLIKKLFFYILRGVYIIRLLKKMETPDIIIFYGYYARILFPLMKFSQRNNTKLIVDVAEWRDYNHFFLGTFNPQVLDIHIALTKLIPKCDAVIAISSYLENYYASKGVKTIRIPVLIDSVFFQENEICYFNSKDLNLIYAGSPGKKDYISIIIKAIESFADIDIKIKIHLLGPSKNDFKVNFLDDRVVYHGKVNQKEVINYLKQADFSLLLRPDKKYSNAGFPTKFVESLNAGTPVISNLTSDLSMYLTDSYNGIIIKSTEKQDIIDAIQKSIILKRNGAINQMKVNARNTSKNFFYYKNYTELFNNLIREV